MKAFVLFLLVLQVLDPTPFAAFGVVGALMFALLVACGLIWRLFNKSAEMAESNQAHNQAQSKVVMDFVDSHRRETTSALTNVVDKVSASHDHLAVTLSSSIKQLETAYNRQSRKLDEVLLTGVVLNKVAQMKEKGDPLDDTVIENIVRRVVNERTPNKE